MLERLLTNTQVRRYWTSLKWSLSEGCTSTPVVRTLRPRAVPRRLEREEYTDTMPASVASSAFLSACGPSWLLRPCYSCPQRCCRCRHSSSNALHLGPGAPRPDALLHQGAPEAEEEEEEEEEEEDQRETNPTILEVLRWTLHRRRTSAAPSPTLRIGSSFSRASIGRRLTSCERSVRSGRAAVWRRAA